MCFRLAASLTFVLMVGSGDARAQGRQLVGAVAESIGGVDTIVLGWLTENRSGPPDKVVVRQDDPGADGREGAITALTRRANLRLLSGGASRDCRADKSSCIQRGERLIDLLPARLIPTNGTWRLTYVLSELVDGSVFDSVWHVDVVEEPGGWRITDVVGLSY